MNTYLLGFVLVLIYLIIKDGRLDYDVFTFFFYIAIAVTSWLGVIVIIGKNVYDHWDEIKKFVLETYLKYFKGQN